VNQKIFRDNYVIKQGGETFLKDSAGNESYVWEDTHGKIDEFRARNFIHQTLRESSRVRESEREG
jgi:hypothetical protein